jgi:hypothetical protein
LQSIRRSQHRTPHDTTRHDTTRHDTTRHDTTRHDTTRHDTTHAGYPEEENSWEPKRNLRDADGTLMATFRREQMEQLKQQQQQLQQQEKA